MFQVFGRFGSFLAFAAVLSFFFVGSVFGQPQQGHEGGSPIDALQEAISGIKSQGKDVAALQAELEQLKPEWKKIQEKQAEIMPLVDAFRPKVEALMKKVHEAGGAVPGESPIVDIQRGIDKLKAHGKDVAALQTELDGLKPDWEAIMKKQSAIQGKPDQAAMEDLEKQMKTFQPRAMELMHKLQALAATLEKEEAPKTH